MKKEYRCGKCKTKTKYAYGIGHYCPNLDCKNKDYGLEEINNKTS